MPIDLPEATTPTTRRTFLTRTVVGGSLAATALAAGSGVLAPLAGAQDGSGDQPATQEPADAPDLEDARFAALATSIELAAGLAYQAALDTEKLDDETVELVTLLQGHHQDVVEALSTMLDAEADAPKPDEGIATEVTEPLADAADQAAVLTALSGLEDSLAATHLWALGGITDAVTAKTAAQVLCSESQAAVVLGRKAGLDVDDLTPATISTAGARTGTN